ncbi:hypothetical protein C0J52_20213 [Blattella germanica]|nr:hypothetical protein C0J52_20213 [Blattella germanica]
MCHVDLPLPAAVRISAVSVVVCRWCSKMGDLTESQRGMILVAIWLELQQQQWQTSWGYRKALCPMS